MKFELNEKELYNLEEFKNALKVIYKDPGIIEYRIAPTEVGHVVRVYSKIANTEKDITDYDSF